VTTPILTRPVVARPDVRQALRSSPLIVDVDEIDIDRAALPRNSALARQIADLSKAEENQDVNTGSVSSPWLRVAQAGRAVGIGASQAGIATASVFQTIGSSVARAFTDGR
jgi:hypothetical protein